MGEVPDVSSLQSVVGRIAIARYNLGHALILWVGFKQVSFRNSRLPSSEAGRQNSVEGIRHLRKQRIAQRVVTVGELIDVQSGTRESSGKNQVGSL